MTMYVPEWVIWFIKANAVVCFAASLIMIFYKRPKGSVFRRWVSIVAYVLILATMAVPYFALTEQYAYLFAVEWVINTIILLQVWQTRGNIRPLLKFDPPWDGHDRRNDQQGVTP